MCAPRWYTISTMPSFVACAVQVNSYPTLMLFDGKGTHKLTTDRSIPGLEKWFAEVLPQAFPKEGDASTDASGATGSSGAVDLDTDL